MAEFKDRLNQALHMREMKPAELAKRTGIGEGAISQYRKGSYKASQRNLDKISEALDVSIPWLMGVVDDAMPVQSAIDNNRTVAFVSPSSEAGLSEFSNKELEHIKKYRRLDADGKRTIDRALDHELERLRQAQTGGQNLIPAFVFEPDIGSDGRLYAPFGAVHPINIHDVEGNYSDVRYVARIDFSDEHAGRFKAGDLIAFSNYADPYHSPEGTVVLVRYGNWAWLAKITGPNRYYPICSEEETAELEDILYGDDEDYEDYIQRKLVRGEAGVEPLGEFIGTIEPYMIIGQDET